MRLRELMDLAALPFLVMARGAVALFDMWPEGSADGDASRRRLKRKPWSASDVFGAIIACGIVVFVLVYIAGLLFKEHEELALNICTGVVLVMLLCWPIYYIIDSSVQLGAFEARVIAPMQFRTIAVAVPLLAYLAFDVGGRLYRVAWMLGLAEVAMVFVGKCIVYVAEITDLPRGVVEDDVLGPGDYAKLSKPLAEWVFGMTLLLPMVFIAGYARQHNIPGDPMPIVSVLALLLFVTGVIKIVPDTRIEYYSCVSKLRGAVAGDESQTSVLDTSLQKSRKEMRRKLRKWQSTSMVLAISGIFLLFLYRKDVF